MCRRHLVRGRMIRKRVTSLIMSQRKWPVITIVLPVALEWRISACHFISMLYVSFLVFIFWLIFGFDLLFLFLWTSIFLFSPPSHFVLITRFKRRSYGFAIAHPSLIWSRPLRLKHARSHFISNKKQSLKVRHKFFSLLLTDPSLTRFCPSPLLLRMTNSLMKSRSLTSSSSSSLSHLLFSCHFQDD